jgi:hypothetical protein
MALSMFDQMQLPQARMGRGTIFHLSPGPYRILDQPPCGIPVLKLQQHQAGYVTRSRHSAILRKPNSALPGYAGAGRRTQVLDAGRAWQSSGKHPTCKERAFMPEERDDQERPCLHCMMVEMIDDFFAEYPAAAGEPDTIDPDEVVTAIAMTVAELTCSQDGAIRQQVIEQLMREIMDYDAEFRRDAGTGAIGSDARH